MRFRSFTVGTLVALIAVACAGGGDGVTTSEPTAEFASDASDAGDAGDARAQSFVLVYQPSADPPSIAVFDDAGGRVEEVPLPEECGSGCMVLRRLPGRSSNTIYLQSSAGLLEWDRSAGSIRLRGELGRRSGDFVVVDLPTHEGGGLVVIDLATGDELPVAHDVGERYNFWDAGARWAVMSGRRTVLFQPSTGHQILLDDDQRLAGTSAIDESGGSIALRVRTERGGAIEVRSLPGLDDGQIWYENSGPSAGFMSRRIGGQLLVAESLSGRIFTFEDGAVTGEGALPSMDFIVSSAHPTADGAGALLRTIADGASVWFDLDLESMEVTPRPDLDDLELSGFGNPAGSLLLDNGFPGQQDEGETYRALVVPLDGRPARDVQFNRDLLSIDVSSDSAAITIVYDLGRLERTGEWVDLDSGVSVELPNFDTAELSINRDGTAVAYTARTLAADWKDVQRMAMLVPADGSRPPQQLAPGIAVGWMP